MAIKQINYVEHPYSADLGVSALLDAVEALYAKQSKRPVTDTRFIVFAPTLYDTHLLISAKELENYTIDFVISPCLERNSWMVCCPDSGGIFISKGA